ncbi:MAG: hydrogenase iron-sulfur subunit [Verrucomicrobia bacterium]|nr:hydrogenase iron-sulfur subunit [Verrucomicrobiota bacterium]MCG2680553.1 hydrogenase iron-sulfur subunit [Kiritimatiellia bacterium]MBU4246887.1 hydrogenase iron-sulfur subunit [Verrucomicrobiota bacterium]MBU4290834.1 hydrogenase iron-sulfur subunit [Verrucomicrobiota bacterium]MBU4429243.1 hydrogenase iron-sulfur subunit [Verrucomicrobiota bacterium]
MKRTSPKLKSGIGVVLCDCGGTLAGRLDFKRLRDLPAEREDVVLVKQCSGFCRSAETVRIVQSLADKGCRRLVVGACRQDIYDLPLAEAMAKARLKPGMSAAALIREQCAWVHPDRGEATTKALELIAAALRRAAYLAPIPSASRKINTNVVVLGGGIAGMHSAIRLADLGHSVALVTHGDELGGCVSRLSDFYSYLDDDADAAADHLKQALTSARDRIQSDRRIRWIARAACQSISGEAGCFSVGIRAGDREQTLKAGAIVLAVGLITDFPLPKGTGSGRILSLPDLADALRRSASVGATRLGEALWRSREPARTGVERSAKEGDANKSLPRSVALVLDMQGEQGRAVHALVLSAAERLAASPRRRVVVYCRHVRVAAWGMESLYRRARSAGALIFRYDKPPRITEQERGILIRAQDTQSGLVVEENFDAVVLADMRSAGGKENLPLPRTLRRGPENAFQADNVWLLSSQSNQPGMYVVGAARGNSELRDAQNDAGAAAEAIHQWMGAGKVMVNRDAPVVDAEKCVLCLTCLRSCPHGAIAVDSKKEATSMSAVACRRCGLCAALCPARAIAFPRCSDDQVLAELTPGPGVTVFACENSAWPAANAAGAQRREYGAKVRLIRVPCAGRVDERYVLGALEQGAGRVLILGCHREACRYLVGADHAAKRVERLQAVLAKAGLDPARLAVGHMAEFETGRFLELVKG